MLTMTLKTASSFYEEYYMLCILRFMFKVSCTLLHILLRFGDETQPSPGRDLVPTINKIWKDADPLGDRVGLRASGMPFLSGFSNLLLLCCSTLNDTSIRNSSINEFNDTAAKPQINSTLIQFANAVSLNGPVIKTELPSWIAPASSIQNKNSQKRPESPLENIDRRPNIGININFPFTEEISTKQRTNSDIVGINRTVSEGSNILQINIFNNGVPISQPTILTKLGLNNNSVQIILESGATEASKKENAESSLPWWKTSVIYQIYPRSFMDSDSSGTGDLRGITSKLNYLKDLGIGAIWISPFYKSPMADFGYDVQDFKDIDPIFGTLEDFDKLLSEIHSRGMKLIMDFVPNHTSNKHEWFIKSEQKIDPFTDYYVWANSKESNGSSNSSMPPNNWLSRFGNSSWEWSDTRKEFYLHQFLKEQPDLNVRNPKVMDELDAILKFWLDKGVDGFRIDALKFLFEVSNIYQDEPTDNLSVDPNEYFYLDHIFTANQPETVDAVRRWRKLFDSYKDRLMVVEVYDKDLDQILKYYGNSTDNLAHFPFNFYLITELQNRSSVTGKNLKKIINLWMNNLPNGSWPNFVLGNHDRGRIASRLGPDLVDAFNMLVLLLPGTPTTYYGEEIGMVDTPISFKNARDPYGLNFGPKRYEEFGRDPSRTPMQWNNDTNAGFSNSSSPWLPLNDNYRELNVDFQLLDNQSSLKVYKTLTKLRQQKDFTHGATEFPFVNENIFAFTRSCSEGISGYMIIINTSEDSIKLNSQELKLDLSPMVDIVLRSSSDNRPETSPGLTVNLESLILYGGEGMVLKLKENSLGEIR